MAYRGALTFIAGIDASPFKSGLEDLRGQAGKFTGDIKGMFAGAFTAGAIVAGARSIVGEFARIKDIADRVGESSESIQRIGYAAEQSGANLEITVKGLQKATANAFAAADGNDELAQTFDQLKINAGQFARLPLEDKLVSIARGLAGIEDPAERLDLALKVLGKSGGEIMPLLIQGADDLAEQMAEAAVATGKTVEQLAAIDDRIAHLTTSFKVNFGGAIAYVSAGFENFVRDFATHADGLGRQIQDLAKAGGSRLRGDVAGAKTWMADFDQAKIDRRQQLEQNKKDSWAWQDSAESSASASPGADDEEAASSAKSAASIREKIAAAEQKAKEQFMSAEELLADMVERRAALEAKANDKTEEGLEAKRELVELTARLAKAEQDAFDAQLAYQRRVDESAEARRTAAMSDEQQAAYFGRKSGQLRQAATVAAGRGEFETAGDLFGQAEEALGRSDAARDRIAAKKADEESTKQGLRDDIAAGQEKRRFDALAPEQQLHELLRRRAALERQANDETLAGLQARRDLLALDDEIADKRKEISERTDEEKRAAEEARAARRKSRETPDLPAEIEEARRRRNERFVATGRVTASSLAAVGGGGNVARGGGTDQQLLGSVTRIERLFVKLAAGNLLGLSRQSYSAMARPMADRR